MLIKNTENCYGFITKLFHWVVGIIVIIMLIAGFIMTNLADQPDKWQIYALHKATGTLVLLLVIVRLLWKFYNDSVALPADLPNWQKKAATININLLYILMLIMPISGFFMSILANHDIDFYGLFTIKSFVQNKELAEISNDIHKTCALIFSALIILHILAAFYHHFIRKDNVFIRIWIR